jgi:hypothetical protein
LIDYLEAREKVQEAKKIALAEAAKVNEQYAIRFAELP